MKIKHPGIYWFVSRIKKECMNTEYRCEQALDGRLDVAQNTRTKKVCQIRGRLENLLLCQEIGLRRFMRTVGALNSKVDKRTKKRMQESDARRSQINITMNDVLRSVGSVGSHGDPAPSQGDPDPSLAPQAPRGAPSGPNRKICD